MYFLNRTGHNSDLTAFISKFRYFADQNEPKGRPRENEYWQFLNTKANVTNS